MGEPRSLRMATVALAAMLLPAAPALSTELVEVTMAQNRFMPASVKVKVGTTVRWNNAGRRNSHALAISGPARAGSPGWSHRGSPGRTPSASPACISTAAPPTPG